MSVKKVIRHYKGKEYKYLYTSNPNDPRIGKTVNGYKVAYKKSGYAAGPMKRKSPTLVSKSGRVYKNRVEQILESAPDRTTKNDIKAAIANWEKFHKGQRLTAKSLQSILSDSKIAKFFINAGYSVEQAAREIGVTPDYLLDQKNWKGSQITTPSGRTFQIEWTNYKKGVFKRA